MQGDCYTVRLLGCCKESNVHKLNVQEQWLWLDDKWILMGRKSGACVNSNFRKKMSSQAAKFNGTTHSEAQINCLDKDKGTGLQESYKLSRSLKRLSQDSSCVIELVARKAQKIRAVRKDGRRQKLVSSVEKVDLVAYPRDIVDELYMRASVDIRMNGYKEPKGEKLDGAAGSYLSRGLESSDFESSDSDSDASSVGSCSVNNEGQRSFPIQFAQVPFLVTGSVCSHAESFVVQKMMKKVALFLFLRKRKWQQVFITWSCVLFAVLWRHCMLLDP